MEKFCSYFDDPDQKEDNTVILLLEAEPAGDTFSIKLSDPVDKNDSNFAIDMGLGISFSYQNSGVARSVMLT